MQYEARNDGSGNPVSTSTVSPWVSINQINAWDECDNLNTEALRADRDNDTNNDGTYTLLSNPEWMTIARNAENIDSNWSGSGGVGDGCLFRGNVGLNDACGYDGADPEFGTGRNTKARLTLSNGSEIWDFSGNVVEMVTWNYTGPRSLGLQTCGGGWTEIPSVSCAGAVNNDYNTSNGTFSSTEGVGRVFGAAGGLPMRGGAWNYGINAGAFSVDFDSSASDAYNFMGFRCRYLP